MLPNSSRFTNDYTNMLKGVALLFLLCNHFCVVKDWVTPPRLSENDSLGCIIEGRAAIATPPKPI